MLLNFLSITSVLVTLTQLFNGYYCSYDLEWKTNSDKLKLAIDRVPNKYLNETVMAEAVARDWNVSPRQLSIWACSPDPGPIQKCNESWVNQRIILTVMDHGASPGSALPTKTSVYVKYLPESSPQNEASNKPINSLHNEIVFYTKIMPKFQQFLDAKNQLDLLLIPKCLAYHADGKNDFIVMNDVTRIRFRQFSRNSNLPFDQLKSMIVAMARLHSISFAYKHEHPEEYKKLASMLIESLYTQEIYDSWYGQFYEGTVWNIARDALAREYPNSHAEKIFNTYTPKQLFDKSIKFCSCQFCPTSVISEGDAFVPNFMFRKTDSGQFEAITLEFQSARSVSPVLDLSSFIYSVTDKAYRDLYYDRILEEYHAELKRSAKLLGLDLDTVYDWETFMKEVKEKSVHGFAFNLEALPADMNEEVFNIYDDVVDIWNISNIEIPEHRKRHADMIVHAVEHGFI